jgi:hypothetical protein
LSSGDSVSSSSSAVAVMPCNGVRNSVEQKEKKERYISKLMSDNDQIYMR